jgi:hypothetical protein
MSSWTQRATAEVNVSLPGVVLSYNSTTQTATVRPVVRESFEDDDGEIYNVDFAPIPSVPVAHWRAGDFAIHAPLKPGDFVTLLVSDRSIDEFMATGSDDVTPQMLRRFDWTDAIAIPMPPSPTPLEGMLDDAMFIGANASVGITMTEAGQIKMEAAGDELLLLVSDLIDKLVSGISGMGSTSFDPATQALLVAIKGRLTAMRAP